MVNLALCVVVVVCFGEIRKRPHRSGAICQVRWYGAAPGARPRHVRVRVVSRFSALQKTGKNIEMAANASVFQLIMYVSEWCGRAVAARLLRGSCPDPARRPVPARFLPGSCPVPARFLPDGRAETASVGRFLSRSRAATAAPLLGAAPHLCGRFLLLLHDCHRIVQCSECSEYVRICRSHSDIYRDMRNILTIYIRYDGGKVAPELGGKGYSFYEPFPPTLTHSLTH